MPIQNKDVPAPTARRSPQPGSKDTDQTQTDHGGTCEQRRHNNLFIGQ